MAPSMASMDDSFKALRGGEGVTGSASSRGVLKQGLNGSNPISMAHGEGDRQCGPMAGAALFWPKEG
jgi:hypothetical protein